MAKPKFDRPTAPATPGGRQTIDRLEQVRVLAHPLRLRLLEIFGEGPLTTMQAAARLDLPATRLYHHVAALERVGFLRLRETRPNRGTIEKYYEVTGRSIEFDPDQLVGPRARSATVRLATEGAAAIALQVLDRAREEVGSALDAMIADPALPDAQKPFVARLMVGVSSEAELRAIQREVTRLVTRIQRMGGSAKEATGRTGRSGKGGAAQEPVVRRAYLTITWVPEIVDGPARKSARRRAGGLSGGRGRRGESQKS
ncbi:MAG: ArsR/SmtB family transcription factor [Candidatus Eiseniibacteriota bacterium]